MKKFLIFLAFFLFFVPLPALAAELAGCIGPKCGCKHPECPAPPPHPPPEGCEPSPSWIEYKANKEECGSEKPEVWIVYGECRWECAVCTKIKENGEKKICECWHKVCTPKKRVAYCNYWQAPGRACKVTAWGRGIITCEAQPSCFLPIKVEKFLDGRGEMSPARVYLPVKFQFEEFATPHQSGWGLYCGPNKIRVRIGDKVERVLDIKEAFSSTTPPLCLGTRPDKEILEDLWNERSPPEFTRSRKSSNELLADFLIKFTGDYSLKYSRGNLIMNTNVIFFGKERKIGLASFSRQASTYYRDYEKLRRGKEFPEIRKQIEYFIHFKENKEMERCYETVWKGEELKHCFCYGGRCPERPYAEKLATSVIHIYSPSQDKKVGPCKIEEGKNHSITIEFCIERANELLCGARGGPPSVSFKTVNAPEPIGILAFKKEDVEFILAARKLKDKSEKEKEEKLIFHATTTLWIDTDWNGDGWPEIPKKFGADFVDFWFCKQNIDLPKDVPKPGSKELPSPSPFEFRALYRGKKMIFDPGKCKRDKDPELKALEEKIPKSCVNINEKCICDEKPEECDKYCGEKGWIKNLDICHPYQYPEPLRVKREEIGNVDEYREKNKRNEEPNKNCTSSYPFATALNIFLGRIEAVKVDWPDNPYYGIENLNIPYPKDLWKWDIYGLNQYFPASPIVNVWQVKKAESQDWSQKWHFQLTTEHPFKEEKEARVWIPPELFREWILLYLLSVIQDPQLLELIAAGNFKKVVLSPMTIKDFEETIRFVPPYLPDKNERREMVFNRLQYLEFKPVGRALSYSIRIFCEKDELNLPIFLSHLRYKKVAGIRESQLKNFTFWEAWACLKCKGKEENINMRRLNRKYELRVVPCKDEWGKESLPIFALLKIWSAGSPPKNLSPPLPNPASIPRYLRFDPAPGAPSYVVEINGEKYFNVTNIKVCEKECPDPVTKKVEECKKGYCPEKEFYFANLKENKKYKWRVKSCADSCSLADNEDYLHCGEFSEPVEFLGCSLKTSLIFPVGGETFLRGENINLSWSKIECNGAPVYYQLKMSFSKTEKEENEEIEKKCKEKDGKLLVDKIQRESNFNFQLDFSCYGTYFWQVRACLTENCEAEAGEWTPPSYFNISKTKVKKGEGVFKGLGTCKNLVPDCPPEGCGIKEIPKLIFNILNCLLWTGIPILIIIGIGFTGFTLIFFATNIQLIERVKQIWQGILIGSLIMLFAWTILNIIFTILKWERETFGDWWNPF